MSEVPSPLAREAWRPPVPAAGRPALDAADPADATDPALDDLVELALRLLDVPVAMVSLVDGERVRFAARRGLTAAAVARERSFCDHVLREPAVMVVRDARSDPRFAAHPFVTGAPGLRFYAGAPLVTPDGQAIGTLCVADLQPRDLDAGARDALLRLARQAMAQLELRRHAAALDAERGALQQAQARLAASEARMALVLKGANDGWWDWDLVTGERYYSPRGWALLGLDAEPPPAGGLHWEALLHPDDRAAVDAAFGAAIRGGADHFSCEMRLRHRDGHYVPMLARGYVLRDDAGRALRVAGTNTDESERKQAERALKAQQQLNEQIVQSSPIGICIYDGAGRCITANPAMVEHIGGDLDRIRAQNLHEIASWRDSGIYRLAMHTLQTGATTSDVVFLETSFGRQAWLSVTFSALVAGGAGRLMLMISDLTDFKRAEQARLESQERYEMLFANSLDGVLLGRPDGSVLAANPAACAMLGLAEAELVARGRQRLLDEGDPRLAALLAQRDRSGSARGEVRMRRAGGEPFEVEIASSVYRGRDGQLLTAAVFRDITERRIWAHRLEESLNLLDNLAQHVPGVLYQFQRFPDGRSCFPFASQGMWQIYELDPDHLLADASAVFQRVHPDDTAAVSAAIAESAATLQPWHQEFRVVLPAQGERWRQGYAQPERRPDGSVLWHGFITDITERKQAEAHTHRLAHYDALTGLPNRRLLMDRMEQMLAAARRSGQTGALLFIDLDNFKQINDARGHAVGDRLLQQVAQRLTALLRGDDAVARLGGDEFVVLAGNLGADADTAARHAMAVAEKVREVLDRPFQIDGLHYGGAGSIGITLFPKSGERVDDLLREADTAMYRAKAAGRNRVAFFEAAMQSEVEERLALEQDLKEALAAGALQVHVQPQFDAAGREAGGELLLRWTHARRGPVAPDRFIPVAEQTGLIRPLGEFVIREACRALATLQRDGRPLSLSVNVSPRQFRQDDFVDGVRAMLAETGADAAGLIFEVTEGLLIDDWQDTLARMSELVALGIRFSIDDFGTGYSSLAYLKRLPLFELKIDRSFVRDTPHDPNDTGIVEAILSVARHLKLRVVAEGVETQAQADFLLAGGCDCLQGFHLARPQPLADWLARRPQAAALAA